MSDISHSRFPPRRAMCPNCKDGWGLHSLSPSDANPQTMKCFTCGGVYTARYLHQYADDCKSKGIEYFGPNKQEQDQT